MATRPKSQQIVEAEAHFLPPNAQTPPTQLRTVTVPEPAPEPVEYDDVTALNKVLDELGEGETGGFVVVHRETATNGKREDEYLDRFPVAEFSLADLKSRWGAGKYKINVYHDGGQGLAARKVITIAKDPHAPSPQALGAAAVQTDLNPVLQAIQQSNEKMIAAIMALAHGQQQKPQSRMEMLTEMQIMRDMFSSNTPAPQYGNPLEMLKMGMEMAVNAGTGGESNNAWVGKVLEQLGPVLLPAIANSVQQIPPPIVERPRMGVSQLAPTPIARPVIEQPSPTKDNPVNIIVAQYLNLLKTAADKKAPVEEYADSILSLIPESELPGIEAMLRAPDWREKLKTRTDAAEQYPEWFGALRDTLLAFIDEDRVLTASDSAGSVSDNVSEHSPTQPDKGDTRSPA